MRRTAHVIQSHLLATCNIAACKHDDACIAMRLPDVDRLQVRHAAAQGNEHCCVCGIAVRAPEIKLSTWHISGLHVQAWAVFVEQAASSKHSALLRVCIVELSAWTAIQVLLSTCGCRALRHCPCCGHRLPLDRSYCSGAAGPLPKPDAPACCVLGCQTCTQTYLTLGAADS